MAGAAPSRLPRSLEAEVSGSPKSKSLEDMFGGATHFSQLDQDSLIAILAHFEAELQARDVAISILRAERSKASLYANTANADRATVLDSLKDDVADSAALHESEKFVQLNVNQFRHLNQLVKAHDDCQNRFTQRQLDNEDRHSREIFQFKDKLEETEKALENKNDGVREILGEHIRALKAECKRKQSEIDQLNTELERRETDITTEQEREKTLVLYLMEERKQLLSQIHRLKLTEKVADSNNHDAILVVELRKQLARVVDERNKYQRKCKELQHENGSLLTAIQDLEDYALRMNATKNKLAENSKSPSSFVVANKAALDSPNEYANTGTVRYNAGDSRTRRDRPSTGIPSPTSRNFPETHFHSNGNSQQRGLPTGSSLPRPNSRHPSMGVRSTEMRSAARSGRPSNSSNSALSSPSTSTNHRLLSGSASDAELSTLDYVLNSMNQNQQSTAIPVTPQSGFHRLTKRSTSLPRKISNGVVAEGGGQPMEGPRLHLLAAASSPRRPPPPPPIQSHHFNTASSPKFPVSFHQRPNVATTTTNAPNNNHPVYENRSGPTHIT